MARTAFLLNRVILGVLGLVAVLSGCQGVTSESNPWVAEFEVARERATSTLGKEILADDQVTDQEYTEAQNAVIRCMEEAGYPGVKIGTWGAEVPTTGRSVAERSPLLKCEVSVDWPDIVILYGDTRRDPTHRGRDVIIAECLVDAGVVDSSFSGADFKEAERKMWDAPPTTQFPLVENYFPFTDEEGGPAAYETCDQSYEDF